MSIPIFQIIPPYPFPPGNHKIVFYICDSISIFMVLDVYTFNRGKREKR